MTSIDYSTYNKKFYETKLLGKGNYAEVYEVVERASKRPYALKLIHFQKFDDQISSAFQEIQIMRVLEHPSIVKLYYYFLQFTECKDDYQSKMILGILMEKGNYSLKEQIHKRSLNNHYFSNAEVKGFIFELVECLAFIQEKNYLHRDIKPQNIICLIDDDANLTYKLCDFGLSVKQHQFSSETVAGTYLYASPKLKEKFQKKQKKCNGNNIKDDVYSLGITLMEMCLLNEDFKFSEGLKSIQKKYGQQVSSLIELMTKFDEEERVDFCDIFKFLKKSNFLLENRKSGVKMEKQRERKKMQQIDVGINHTKKKEKEKFNNEQYYLLKDEISCFEIIKTGGSNCLLVASCYNSLAFIYDNRVHYVQIPNCKKLITCLCYDEKMGLLWFGCLDSYLRCISVENLFLKLSNSESLDADDLGLELKGQLNPISCLCLGPENYEPITGFFNGDIKVQWCIKPLKTHNSCITAVRYLNDQIYSSCIDGTIKRQSVERGKNSNVRIRQHTFECGVVDFDFINTKASIDLIQVMALTINGYFYILNEHFDCRYSLNITNSDIMSIAFNGSETVVVDVQGNVINVLGKTIHRNVSKGVSCIKQFNNTIYISTFTKTIMSLK